MAVTVQEMSDADFHRGFEILSDAFAQDHEYINIVFPNHETPAGRVVGGRRLASFKQAQSFAHFLKAVDADGTMIGMAKWNLLHNEIPPETGLGTTEFWDDLATAEYADALYRSYLIERRRAIRESDGNLASLDLLIIDPKHQRKGVGRALIRWGLQRADEMGVEAVVEALVVGKPTYEAEGFKSERLVTLEFPELPAFKNRPKQVFYWMVRPKKTAIPRS